MPKNTRRGNSGHSFRAGPYDRPQNESGGRGRGRGRGRGGVRGRRGRGGFNAQLCRGRGFGRGRGAFVFDGGNGPGGYHPFQGSGWGRGAGAGGPNFYEGPGRAADPAFRWGQQVDEEHGYGYQENEQEAPSYGSPAQ
ncbi:hypothetical protein FOFC_10487 [Fusarium oxysporum]|nr:hypothetical protein FOFC_10487 [Fusarium oxysporum]